MSTVRERVRVNREVEITTQVKELEEVLNKDGWSLTYGTIGKRTTYLLLTRDEEEIVGYTFVRDLKYHNENVGRLKALQQAIARKDLTEKKGQ